MTTIIALKGAFRDFYNLLTVPRTVYNKYSQGCSYVQIMCNMSNAYHVQPAVCHLVRTNSSAIKFDRVVIAFIWALFYWLKPINRWRRGGNWSTWRKPLTTSVRKCHILKPGNSSPKWDLNPHSSIDGRLGKQMCYPLYHSGWKPLICFCGVWGGNSWWRYWWWMFSKQVRIDWVGKVLQCWSDALWIMCLGCCIDSERKHLQYPYVMHGWRNTFIHQICIWSAKTDELTLITDRLTKWEICLNQSMKRTVVNALLVGLCLALLWWHLMQNGGFAVCLQFLGPASWGMWHDKGEFLLVLCCDFFVFFLFQMFSSETKLYKLNHQVPAVFCSAFLLHTFSSSLLFFSPLLFFFSSSFLFFSSSPRFFSSLLFFSSFFLLFFSSSFLFFSSSPLFFSSPLLFFSTSFLFFSSSPLFFPSLLLFFSSSSLPLFFSFLPLFFSSPLLSFSSSFLFLFFSSPLLFFSTSFLFFSSSPLFFSSPLLFFSSSSLPLSFSSPLLFFPSSFLPLFFSSPLLLFFSSPPLLFPSSFLLLLFSSSFLFLPSSFLLIFFSSPLLFFSSSFSSPLLFSSSSLFFSSSFLLLFFSFHHLFFSSSFLLFFSFLLLFFSSPLLFFSSSFSSPLLFFSSSLFFSSPCHCCHLFVRIGKNNSPLYPHSLRKQEERKKERKKIALVRYQVFRF